MGSGAEQSIVVGIVWQTMRLERARDSLKGGRMLEKGGGHICVLVYFITGRRSIETKYANMVRLHIPLVARGDR